MLSPDLAQPRRVPSAVVISSSVSSVTPPTLAVLVRGSDPPEPPVAQGPVPSSRRLGRASPGAPRWPLRQPPGLAAGARAGGERQRRPGGVVGVHVAQALPGPA